ncbi:MAG: tetratricopeptide repeat protein, partial [Candidatus Acidiferrales bacterium]
GQTSIEIRARFPIPAAILLAMAGAREYTSAVRRAAPGSESLSVSTFGTIIFTLAVLELSSIAGPAASAAQQRSATGLPAQCLHPISASEPLQQLLEAITDHPTAGAYNTLGALFAQQSLDACAIASFEAGLRLDPKNWEARYNLALALMKRGDRQRAIQELRRAIAEKPDSASAHHALGTLFEAEKKLPEAAVEYQAVLHADPHFPSAAIDLARVLAAQRKFDDAVAVLQEALQLSPEAEDTVSLGAALGVTYAESGNFAKASETLRQLIADHPDSAGAHLALGTVLAQQGEPASGNAMAEFREAMRLDPDAAPARLALGGALLDQKKYSDALSVLQEYLGRHPDDAQEAQRAEGYHLEGQIYEGLDQWDQAGEALLKAARLEPGDYEIRKDLAWALVHAGRTSDAIHEFEAAEKLSPKEAEVHQQLAALYEKTDAIAAAKLEREKYAKLTTQDQQHAAAGKLNDQANKLLASGNARGAAEAYRQALRLAPNDAQMHYNLSLALDRLGDGPGEIQELQRAVRLDPQLAVVHNQLGLLALTAGRQADAERELKAAIAINPKFAEALNNLGVLNTQQGKDSQAATLFQQATQYDPSYSRAFVNLGLTLARHGQFAEAEKQIRAALEADPKDASAYRALGMVEAKLGRDDDAIAGFRKAVELEPQSSEAHLNLGIALVDHFDRAGGFAEFSEAVRLDPKSASAHFNLGRFYFESSKYDDARRELETASTLQPRFANALYFLALVERQSGNVARSAELLQKVVEIQPGQADAQFLLGQDLAKLGKTTQAIEHWKLALEADPDDSQALYTLARALNKAHDPAAERYQQRFDDLKKQQQVTDQVSELGNFAIEASNAQNWPQAIEQMQQAIQLCGDCAQSGHLHRNLGLFYCKTGKFEDAETELKKALDLDPNDAEAKRAISIVENLRSSGAK